MSCGTDEETSDKKDVMRSNDIYIGTAGYSYAHWRKGVFYPSGGVTQAQELRHYSGVFAAVEINASFHAVPREETLQTWAKNAKSGFSFSFKVPQKITHEKRLENIEQDLKFFLDRLMLSPIKPCLGPILFQLPPSLPKDVEKLKLLAKMIPEECRVAFEFRNKTWYCSEVYDTMRHCDFGLCENISPDNSTLRVHNVARVGTTAKTWHYIRCHKRGDQQITNYTNQQLENIADQLVERRNRNIVQFCFFLNDHEGNGPRNAKTLMKFIKEKDTRASSFVHNWKPDPVAPSIAALFAKSVGKNAAGRKENPPTKPTRTNTGNINSNKKTRSIDSFFSPSASDKTPTSPTAKRLKTTTSNSSATKSNKSKKGTISSFFQVKKS